MQNVRVQGSLLSATSPTMLLRTMFPSNTLIMNVYLNWEMKVLGLDERTDYARDIFGPSWLKFDELRYEHAQKRGTNTKIMSKLFEITEQKRKPGNNPSSMHHDTYAKSLCSAFFYYFLGKALQRSILLQKPLGEAQYSDHIPLVYQDNSEQAEQEIIRLWSLLTNSAADISLHQKHTCARATLISDVSAKEKPRSWNCLLSRNFLLDAQQSRAMSRLKHAAGQACCEVQPHSTDSCSCQAGHFAREENLNTAHTTKPGVQLLGKGTGVPVAWARKETTAHGQAGPSEKYPVVRTGRKVGKSGHEKQPVAKQS